MAQESPSDQHASGSYIAQAGQGSSASVNVYSTPPPPKDINRHRLLAKVRAFWITGVLEQSLHGADLIELELQEQSDATLNPWRLVVQEVDHPISSLPSGTLITQVYDQTEGELLILGSPGAGKTTLLLQLARDLINRAKQDEEHPIPVIFNLSSWATKCQPLTEWLVDELNSKYQVPQKLGREWVAGNQILPLLDGLDEVMREHRTACVEAINAYRQEHGLVPMVVCCRSADYDTLLPSICLSLRSAVVVQPLTPEQIDKYLASGGEKLAAIREVLQTDPDLQDIAKTPLMLSVLMQAYAGRRPDDLVAASSPQLRRQQVFATYVERMLHRRGPKTQYTPQQVKYWLSWLAKQMTQHGQTEFYLERMQPDWLSSMSEQSTSSFGTLARVAIGVFFGVIALLIFWLYHALLSLQPLMSGCVLGYGLIFGLIGGTLYGLVSPVDTSIKPTETIRWSWGSIWQRLSKSEAPLVGLLLGMCGLLLGWLDPEGPFFNMRIERLLGALIFGMLGGQLFSLFRKFARELVRNAREQQMHATLKQGIWHSIYNRLLVGLIFGLVNGLIFGLLIALLVGVIEIQVSNPSIVLQDMLRYGLIGTVFIWILSSGLLFGVRYRVETDLEPIKVFVWLCRSVWLRLIKSEELTRGLAFGLIFALLFWMVEKAQGQHFRLAEGFVYGLLGGLIFRLFSELISGLSSTMMEEQTLVRPNQGIWRSACNSGLVGLIFGVLAALFFGLTYGLVITGVGNWRNWLFSAIYIGVSYGLLSTLLIGLPNGGVACIQHGILRRLLRRTGSIPRHYTHFLNYAAERILLRKVGGGYIFIHRLLLEYFAAQNFMPTPTRVAERGRWKYHVSKVNSFTLCRIILLMSIILGTTFPFWDKYLYSYPAANTSRTLVDPLDTSKSIWPEQSDPYGACRFTHHAYQVTSNSRYTSGKYCRPDKSDFRNFTFEVEMAIIKGDYASIIFRDSLSRAGTAYAFFIGQDGSYKFKSYSNRILLDNKGDQNSLLVTSFQPKIRTDFHQMNKIAVVAYGNTFDLYVNHRLIIRTNDPKNTSDRGYIGFSVSSMHKASSEALFRHATIWING